MQKPQVRYTQPFLGGEYRRDIQETFPSYNPATGQVIAQVSACREPQLDEAAEAARRAQSAWWGKKAEERSSTLRAIAAAIRANQEEIALLETLDSGIPYAMARRHYIAKGADFFDYYAAMADKLHGRVVPIDPAFLSYNIHEPWGVVGILLPWNAPFTELCLASAAALCCGNAVVVKPASATSLTALLFGSICAQAGLPAGLLNILPGSGEVLGEAMARHPGIDKLVFTGSLEMGRRVLRNAADTVKSCTMELGGKTPVLVFEDCDLDRAVESITFSAFRNTGQVCTAASRLYLHQSIAQEFIGRMVQRAQAYRTGDPFCPQTDFGPVVSAAHRDRILRYVQEGRQSGARVLLEGGAPTEPELQAGYYVKPVIFADPPQTASIAREEIFGPVLSVFTFTDTDEVLARANCLPYGLGASVWTSSIRTAQYCASRLEDGLVWINCINLSHPAIAHSGYKQSGMGIQNGIEAALITYTRTKTVWMANT